MFYDQTHGLQDVLYTSEYAKNISRTRPCLNVSLVFCHTVTMTLGHTVPTTLDDNIEIVTLETILQDLVSHCCNNGSGHMVTTMTSNPSVGLFIPSCLMTSPRDAA
jgi:hypothetical protein